MRGRRAVALQLVANATVASLLSACLHQAENPHAGAPQPVGLGSGAEILQRDTQPHRPDAVVADSRKTRLVAHGYVNPALLGRPGYYNLFLFSTDHCDPCELLWEAADTWVHEYPNLVVTDVDVTEVFEGGNQAVAPEIAILRDFGLGRIPSAILVSPLGYVVVAKDGADAIRAMVQRALAARPYREVLSFAETAEGGDPASAPLRPPYDGRSNTDDRGDSSDAARRTTDSVSWALRKLELTDLVRSERADGNGPVIFRGQTPAAERATVTVVARDTTLASAVLDDLRRSGVVFETDAALVAVVVDKDTDHQRAVVLADRLWNALGGRSGSP